MAVAPTAALPPVDVPKDEVAGAVDAALLSNPKKITLEKIDDNTYRMTVEQ